jgi:hypothetical protein
LLGARNKQAGTQGWNVKHGLMATLLGAALLLPACSSRPRAFEPSLAALPADQQKFALEYATCERLLVEGTLDSQGRLASAATAAGAVATVGTAGGVAATSAGLYAGAGIASLTLVALPFVAIGSAWGVAKAKQKRKEAAIKRVMAGCLEDRGYKVVGWTRAARSTPAPQQGAKE